MRPGFALASRISSCSDDVGNVAVITNTRGSVAMRATGANALRPSNGSFAWSVAYAIRAGVASSNVEASGDALATTSAASTLFARLSMLTGPASLLAIVRATTSAAVPAAAGTTQLA